MADAEGRDVRHVFDKPHAWRLPQRADDLVVPGASDQEYSESQSAETSHLPMDLRDQGAGGVHDLQIAFSRVLVHGCWHAVSAQHDHCLPWDLVELADEYRAGCGETAH